MGECPEWYALIRAARYLSVSPWELAEKPFVWRDWALEAEASEAEAQKVSMGR